MSTKKKTPKSNKNKLDIQALLDERKKVLDQRSENLAANVNSIDKVAPSQILKPLFVEAAGGFGDNGTVIAEGDSWFDYPGDDILSILDDYYGYEVLSSARRGHYLESMAYERDQFVDVLRNMEKAVRRGVIPKAILISGGGNDASGSPFELLLEHARGSRPGLNQKIAKELISGRLRKSLIDLIRGIEVASKRYFGTRIPIIIHGYGAGVPDGRGYKKFFIEWSGPWLEPGFNKKGFDFENDSAAMIRIVKQLNDQFNDMLRGVASMKSFSSFVQYLNLRSYLSNDENYKKSWDNELHPEKEVFKTIAAQFANQIG